VVRRHSHGRNLHDRNGTEINMAVAEFVHSEYFNDLLEKETHRRPRKEGMEERRKKEINKNRK
jgi:hypothetical protein